MNTPQITNPNPDYITSIHIPFSDYHVAHVKIIITYEMIQSVLRELYRRYHGNPEYIFVSEREREAVASHDDHGIIRRFGRIFQILNEETGRMVHLVPLPNLEPDTVILGFFPQR